ncbi:MAG: cysteine hydrolase family protein [Petrotogales bacterium]
MKRVFVDVDTQCDFMNKNGNLYVTGAEGIKNTLFKITKLAKDEKITVLKTLDCHKKNDPEFSQFPPHCIEETEGAAPIRETANKRAVNFEKKTFDVFDKKLGNPNIDKWLKENKVTEAWVYGVATEICVIAAVKGLLARGITTYVFENAIKGIDVENEKKAIEEMKKAGAHLAVAKL